MSVTSVLPSPPTLYGPIYGNSSQSAKLAVLPKQSQPATLQFEKAFAQTLRADGATRTTPKSGTSEPGGSRSSAGIALYQRINRIGNEHSTSELLEKWNSIMQSGQDPGDAGAATLRALFQNEEPASGSRILDVTA